MAAAAAAVPDKVLSWLYSVLHEYPDAPRTYADAARTLALYPSLAPRTDVYTHDTGASALLLTLSGTLPVVFRGTTYHFPVTIWVPHAYPHDAPHVHVTPPRDMVVRPGQHVAVDGRVYHPYLRDWPAMRGRATMAELVAHLQHIFAREPPVVSRAQQRHSSAASAMQATSASAIQGASASAYPIQATSGAPPPPPPKQSTAAAGPSRTIDANAPPPLPPKPGATPVAGEEYADPHVLTRDGPPLPPLPHGMLRNHRISSLSSNGMRPASVSPAPSYAAHSPSYQHGGPPAGPPHLHHAPHQQYQTARDNSPVSPISPPRGVTELPTGRYAQPAPAPQFRPHQQSPAVHHNPAPYPQAHQQHYIQQVQVQQAPPQQQYFPPQPPQQKAIAPDLLTDPFDVAIPSPATQQHVPAPPIPPNPEKEHLLQALALTLSQQAQQKVNQNQSAIAPLQAQQQALYAAHQRLDSEIRQLEQLEQALSNNESILHHSIQDCDRTIATARSKKQPPIDEVLIAPTMVANQLWTLCAEEAACREAMYVLQKANDRGRISGDVFIRQMRGLGRECFLKMALARKCAAGMGLDVRT